jgi:hypothetical protein
LVDSKLIRNIAWILSARRVTLFATLLAEAATWRTFRSDEMDAGELATAVPTIESTRGLSSERTTLNAS